MPGWMTKVAAVSPGIVVSTVLFFMVCAVLPPLAGAVVFFGGWRAAWSWRLAWARDRPRGCCAGSAGQHRRTRSWRPTDDVVSGRSGPADGPGPGPRRRAGGGGPRRGSPHRDRLRRTPRGDGRPGPGAGPGGGGDGSCGGAGPPGVGAPRRADHRVGSAVAAAAGRGRDGRRGRAATPAARGAGMAASVRRGNRGGGPAPPAGPAGAGAFDRSRHHGQLPPSRSPSGPGRPGWSPPATRAWPRPVSPAMAAFSSMPAHRPHPGTDPRPGAATGRTAADRLALSNSCTDPGGWSSG